MQLSEDLQLIKKIWNHTGNQKKGRTSLGDQQANYLQAFQRLY